MSAGAVTRRVTPSVYLGTVKADPDPAVTVACVVDLWERCPLHDRVHDGDVACLFTADAWF